MEDVTDNKLMTSSPIIQEKHRFVALLNQLVENTFLYVDNLSDVVWNKVPIDTPVMFLGTRVNTINIAGLIRHLLLAESYWFDQLAHCKNGDIIPITENTAIIENINNGMPLIEAYKASHNEGIEKINSMTETDLNKNVFFVDRQYTVMGFLWMTYGHHAYHIGQLDLLLRQMNIEPPDYVRWPNNLSLIA